MGSDASNLYRSLRVLVVDDHMLMRNMISQNLRSLGIQNVESASNGEDAWKEITCSVDVDMPYHIIFLDWHMPGIAGIDVLKHCRDDKRLAKTAVVMLTAEQEQKNIMKAIENGATSYLIKPVSRDIFEEKLQKVVQWLLKKNPELATEKPRDKKKQIKQDSDRGQQDLTQFSDELRADLQPVVARGIEKIFSGIFKVKIISNKLVETGLSKEMVCVGRLHQDDVKIALRFFFDQSLLRPLLRQLYAPDFLTEDAVYEDAACEIVNILCSQVKAFLNQHGYELILDMPEMGVKEDMEDASSIMNIHFTLNEDQFFLVDVSANAGG